MHNISGNISANIACKKVSDFIIFFNLIGRYDVLTVSRLAKYLIKDINGDWSKPSIKFFRSNGAYGYIIWLTIINYYFEKKEISIEKLVTDVASYASRRTVLEFINKGVEGKFINKKTSNEDKRKILIEPSDTTIKEYSEWSSTFIKSVI